MTGLGVRGYKRRESRRRYEGKPMGYDLITMGRIGVDLYPLQTGVPLPQVTSFGKFLGARRRMSRSPPPAWDGGPR